MAFELSHSYKMKGVATAPRPPPPPIAAPQALADTYIRRANEIEARHNAQTADIVAALREKYVAPVMGHVAPWTLVEKLAACIDPTDRNLLCTSQQMHVLQMIDAMEAEGTASDEWLLVALVHDIGKVLLLAGEAPENVVCMNKPISVCAPGGGLDNCVFQWNHDEFAYSRLKDHLPDGLAWLVRYHSILPDTCEQYMDARDREYHQRYLRPFARYDHGTKSPMYLPQRRLQDYRHVVERALPASMLI